MTICNLLAPSSAQSLPSSAFDAQHALTVALDANSGLLNPDMLVPDFFLNNPNVFKDVFANSP